MTMKKCKECNNELSSKARNCPNCGADQRNFFIRHQFFTVILAFIFLGVLGAVFRGNGSNSTSIDTATPIADYAAQCKGVAYDDLARQPDRYNNSKVKFTGQIVQIQDSGANIILRVNVTKGNYNIYKDTIWVNYTYYNNQKKFLENDIVNIWGEAKGNITYTSIFKQKITIPQINARLIRYVGEAY